MIELINVTDNPENIVGVIYLINNTGCTIEEARRMANDTERLKEIIEDVSQSSEKEEFKHISYTFRISSDDESDTPVFLKNVSKNKVITLSAKQIFDISDNKEELTEYELEVLKQIIYLAKENSPYIFSKIVSIS